MLVTKVMPVYFASFSTENLKSLNVPGKKKRFYARAPTPPVTTFGTAGTACVAPTPNPGNHHKAQENAANPEAKGRLLVRLE